MKSHPLVPLFWCKDCEFPSLYQLKEGVPLLLETSQLSVTLSPACTVVSLGFVRSGQEFYNLEEGDRFCLVQFAKNLKFQITWYWYLIHGNDNLCCLVS